MICHQLRIDDLESELILKQTHKYVKKTHLYTCNKIICNSNNKSKPDFSQKYLINDVSQQISTNIKRNNNGEEKKIKYTLKYYENYQNNKNK